ncbi:prenyltransferase/squalene oxidase repeat-containing protein [Mechercharimyces sp. CAU 1602]|uniref:terpene cyclase/mutase family protein n=1 Tax=Mechercharimyces sp. CAU 1602 TaxID=2973933 RepID=UPI0021626244|nr:prenyltransferase/squalene oxidase repeat-containing protein [Mechercharimyces sp. CAU 1602]MCS1351844.1 squalene--hopene cyclase [Mechercharimyces sp. CAU 1602]
MSSQDERLEQAIASLQRHLLSQQCEDGRFLFCFEGSTMTDAYRLLLLQTMEEEENELDEQLRTRIHTVQSTDGAWRLYDDEKEGNLGATVESCVGLLYAGESDGAPAMKQAQEAIRMMVEEGQPLGSYTQVMMTALGHFKWDRLPAIPLSFFFIPPTFPINFFDFVSYARAHIAPIMLMANKKFSMHLPRFERVERWLHQSGLFSSSHIRNGWDWSAYELESEGGKWIQKGAQRWGEEYLLHRLEADGTMSNYFSATFLTILTFLAQGYGKEHPLIAQANEGLNSYLYPMHEGWHQQLTDTGVWDTALSLYALLESGLDPEAEELRRGLYYLLVRQHTRKGDWALRNPDVRPGGWGFSQDNTFHPDVDDTSYCLRVLSHYVDHDEQQECWQRGHQWLISMQNADGGWPAFERNTDKKWLTYLPYRDGNTVFSDPSMSDLTGRTLHFFAETMGWDRSHPSIKKGVEWLIQNQEVSGCWFGRWGVSYVYGTWAALTGLVAAGLRYDDAPIAKGVKWLLARQQLDGGWGESCASDRRLYYVSLAKSTPSQTAWALDALIATHDQPTTEIEAGVKCLLQLMEQENWQTRYPTGAGFTGQYYIHYHSYRYVWPLLALAHYKEKYLSGSDNQ